MIAAVRRGPNWKQPETAEKHRETAGTYNPTGQGWEKQSETGVYTLFPCFPAGLTAVTSPLANTCESVVRHVAPRDPTYVVDLVDPAKGHALALRCGRRDRFDVKRVPLAAVRTAHLIDHIVDFDVAEHAPKIVWCEVP